MAEERKSGNMIANIIVQGRLTKDAEVRQSKNGNTFVTYTVANNPYTPNGVKTNFYDCIQSGNLSWLKKGMLVVVEGAPDFNEYTDKDGNKRRNFRINVSALSAEGNIRRNSGATPSASTEPADEIGEEVDDDDDLPF